MILRNNNKGFSLIELVVAVAILAIIASLITPSFITSLRDARVDKDYAKFDSICTAFKTAICEPDVQQEAEAIGGGSPITAAFKIDQNGSIVFADGQLVGTASEPKVFSTTKLWLNAYQSIGNVYEMGSSDFNDHYVLFIITPKTATTTAACEYRIVKTYS